MNRAIDGVATPGEREELARVLRVDALLRSEFEELQSVHACTESLFRQIALCNEFSQRVMRRIQTGEVPSDEGLESVRLPAARPLKAKRARSRSQRRVRLYAVIASVSAAAAFLLAAGVFSGFFARAGIGTQGVEPAKTDGEKPFTADGRRGVPDREELNRTDSSTHQPSNTDGTDGGKAPKGAPRQDPPAPKDPAPEVEEPKRDSAPDKVTVEPLPPKPKSPEPVQPDEPEPEEVVKKDETPGTEPEQPKGDVDSGKTPDSGKTVAAPVERKKIGTLQVMSGRAELVASDGSTSRFKDQDQELFEGDRIRTRYNACVRLKLATGDLTLGRDTQILLSSAAALTLEQYDGKERGQLALNRESTAEGDSLEVKVEDYEVFLMHGAALIERKRHGMLVTKTVGFATITHDTFGSVLLDETSGYESDIEFGKEYAPPKARRVSLPDWASKSRRQDIMTALSPVIADRKYSASERSYVINSLPDRLDDLLVHATTNESVITLLTTAIRNEKLTGAGLIKLVSEVEVAYFDVSELTPEAINDHANRAAMAAEGFDQWKDYFYRLMRPPVEPKSKSSSTTTESSDPTKLKRVDDPPVKKVKTQNNGSDPEEEEEESPEREK
ncbi:MAG: hypothetical protein H6839_05315 [Planctomycetes bacterium]|nr:hypothetical protein [Planctomycetota bacterium]